MFQPWVVGTSVLNGLYKLGSMVRSNSDVTGHVVTVVIALDILDMWSVLCVPYVGGGI